MNTNGTNNTSYRREYRLALGRFTFAFEASSVARLSTQLAQNKNVHKSSILLELHAYANGSEFYLHKLFLICNLQAELFFQFFGFLVLNYKFQIWLQDPCIWQGIVTILLNSVSFCMYVYQWAKHSFVFYQPEWQFNLGVFKFWVDYLNENRLFRSSCLLTE